jgi:hypothetical protein
MGQGNDTSISQVLALDESNSSQFRQLSQVPNTGICQTRTARQIDVPNPIASFDQLNDGIVCQVDTMTEVNVMQVLGQLANR